MDLVSMGKFGLSLPQILLRVSAPAQSLWLSLSTLIGTPPNSLGRPPGGSEKAAAPTHMYMQHARTYVYAIRGYCSGNVF
jgi:hypothetical protein